MKRITDTIASLSPEKRALFELLLKDKDHKTAKKQKRPTIIPAPEDRHSPFPLTDVQEAYWIGRKLAFEMGSVSTHSYWEIEALDFDLERFNLTLNHLIERHEMLRAIFLPNGFQKIMKDVPAYQIEILDLRENNPKDQKEAIESIRESMSHQVLPSDKWPLFDIRATLLGEKCTRLHFSLDALAVDGWSYLLVFKEWSELYHHPEKELKPIELTFRDYVLAEKKLIDSDLYKNSRDYWLNRLDKLPPAPVLPLIKHPSSVKRPRFKNRKSVLLAKDWLLLKKRANKANLTPSTVLLAAYAEILKAWSKDPRFTLNLTLFNRQPLHPQVNEVVGDFTSLTLVEVNSSENHTFEERARHLQKQLWSDLDHRCFSGVQVQRELNNKFGRGLATSMPIVFTSVINPEAATIEEGLMDWIGKTTYQIFQTPQIWIDHVAIEERKGVNLIWNAVDELFPPNMLDSMFSSYCGLLKLLAVNETLWQETWPEMARRLVPAEQIDKQATINDTYSPLSVELLHTLFEKRVSQQLDQPALISSGKHLSYQQLFHQSNQVGNWLRQRGSQPNTLVGIVMEKGWEQVVAVLGTLASGAAYLPIDAALPEERLNYLLDDGQVTLVLTQPKFNSTINWPNHIQRFCINDENLKNLDAFPLQAIQKPEDLAYVIYTSGSTGLPKGVMTDHRGAVNTILDMNERFSVNSNDRILALSSLSFDLSVYDIFGILAAGGTIVMPDVSGTRDPHHWLKLIHQEQVSIWNTVPILMQLLVEHAHSTAQRLTNSLRVVWLSGDWIPLTLPEQIKSLTDNVQIISLGGATEASIWSIMYPIKSIDPMWKSIPYGKAMTNQQFYVLNEVLEQRPCWVPGQLYIGGTGLAKGYWQDEDRTNEHFIIHPRTGDRLYRTGDMGCYLPDGHIEFLGREDFQVKIQGFRVELGEIESVLTAHPQVQEAIVSTQDEEEGDKKLVAYVIPKSDMAPEDINLRNFLNKKLPNYMVPQVYMLMDTFPLSINGKIDRKALPDISKIRPVVQAVQAPKGTDLVCQILKLVNQVLKMDTLDEQTSFLKLGASSIDMIRIANFLESETGFRPKIGELYRHPTVHALTQSYEQYLQANKKITQDSKTAVGTPTEPILNSYKLLLDPDDRAGFKKKQPGIRSNLGGKDRIALNNVKLTDSIKKQYVDRRSHRLFSKTLLPFEHFTRFLSCLMQVRLRDTPKYLYASAGGLYSVQTYMYIKPKCIESLPEGFYYYHPIDHQLVHLSKHNELPADSYDPIINRPIFDQSAFAMFLIADYAAIAPMYGARSQHYAAIEAGLISQLLENTASEYKIGLCQIGELKFEKIRDLFMLDNNHNLVHSLLGGPINSSMELPAYVYPAHSTMEDDFEEGSI